jgi:hypothetical protein
VERDPIARYIGASPLAVHTVCYAMELKDQVRIYQIVDLPL